MVGATFEPCIEKSAGCIIRRIVLSSLLISGGPHMVLFRRCVLGHHARKKGNSSFPGMPIPSCSVSAALRSLKWHGCQMIALQSRFLSVRGKGGHAVGRCLALGQKRQPRQFYRLPSSSSEGSVCHAGGVWRRVNRLLICRKIASMKWNHRFPNRNTAARNSRNAPISPKGIFHLTLLQICS